jgi:hypothetical protein
MALSTPRVFLSYAREDEPFVRRLRVALTSAVPGIQFFLPYHITPGDAWSDLLTRMVESSHVVLVVSARSRQSPQRWGELRHLQPRLGASSLRATKPPGSGTPEPATNGA